MHTIQSIHNKAMATTRLLRRVVLIAGCTLNCTLICPGMSLITTAQADEVYVWTDDQGKKHFGDKPPAQIDVEVEQETYEIHNRDSGYPYTDPDLYKNQTETLSEKKKREQAERLASQRQLRAAMAGPCDEARKQLSMLQGPVAFYDDEGHEIRKTESEREQEFNRLKREIARRCP